eukprot:CAMPEP_0182600616 /NCGR_PEP_ID=MMETSP1324-20130603/91068_1 /TAXON_ID=236786 /ORGANISM="Florenciella sp., Strain RCC1587" /LENGTH=124 /DNA_ID=CAMNT_0024818523 /DNA_START=652 /DNA_END=1026 /DNA_ORIENTATION=-
MSCRVSSGHTPPAITTRRPLPAVAQLPPITRIVSHHRRHGHGHGNLHAGGPTHGGNHGGASGEWWMIPRGGSRVCASASGSRVRRLSIARPPTRRREPCRGTLVKAASRHQSRRAAWKTTVALG